MMKPIKTEWCNNILELGYCFINDCKFVHYKEELNEIKINNYKKEYCLSYHENGICYYGKRCSFIHDNILENELKIKSKKRLKVFENITNKN